MLYFSNCDCKFLGFDESNLSETKHVQRATEQVSRSRTSIDTIEPTKNIRQNRTNNSFCSNFHPLLFDTINSSSDTDTTVISIRSNLNRSHNHICKCTCTLYILSNNLFKNKASVKNITLYFQPIFPHKFVLSQVGSINSKTACISHTWSFHVNGHRWTKNERKMPVQPSSGDIICIPSSTRPRGHTVHTALSAPCARASKRRAFCIISRIARIIVPRRYKTQRHFVSYSRDPGLFRISISFSKWRRKSDTWPVTSRKDQALENERFQASWISEPTPSFSSSSLELPPHCRLSMYQNFVELWDI